MTVYIDQPRLVRGKWWTHMLADTAQELHYMAWAIGLRPEWFQGDHYDICSERKRQQAIQLGARQVTSRDLIDVRRRFRDADALNPFSTPEDDFDPYIESKFF